MARWTAPPRDARPPARESTPTRPLLSPQRPVLGPPPPPPRTAPSLAGHHSKLREANKEKLRTLASLLVQRYLRTMQPRAAGAAPPAFPRSALLQPLVPSIRAIAEQIPLPVAEIFRAHITAAGDGWTKATEAAKEDAKEKAKAKARAERRAAKAAAPPPKPAKKGKGKAAEKAPIGPVGETVKPKVPAHVSPEPATLALFMLIASLYSLTDFRHCVVTPASYLVGEILSQERLPATGLGLRRLLFLCSAAMEIVSPGTKWMPELHAAIVGLLSHLLAVPAAVAARADDPAATSSKKSWWAVVAASGALPKKERPWYGPSPRIGARWLSVLGGGAAGSGAAAGAAGAAGDDDPPEAPGLSLDSLCCDGSAEQEADWLEGAHAMIYDLTTDLTNTYASTPCFIELFSPVLGLLWQTSERASARPEWAVPARLQRRHDALTELIGDALRLAYAARNAVDEKPAPPPQQIKQYNPAFDDDFQPDRSLDPDRQRAELQKLKRKTKKEAKGAMRELRKDAAFLAATRQKEKAARDGYLEARGKRALAIMEEQEHAVKSMKKQRRDEGQD